jgi:tetratricopeptide (TPR) repeat protein
MAVWHSSNQDHNRALEINKQALQIFHAIGDQHSEAIALNGIGQAYQNLSQYANALFFYKNALTIFENTRTLDAASDTTFAIASTHYLSGNLDQALSSYERCLQLSRTVGKHRIEAYALEGIASIYGTQGRQQLAVKQYQDLERFFKSIGDLRGQAMALNGHGDLLLRLGEKQKALDVLSQAFSLSEKMGDRGILIATLYNLARANEALERHETALSLIKTSFNLIEDIRANVASPDFRASYFSDAASSTAARRRFCRRSFFRK